ncbi:dihydrolipoamide acetyltransferase [Chloropicon primus]|uniref:Acetyltransferase component of pyruvate dehydrogenase complex n=1 Tax=Chloropicon primus TaxID=1764295 RepID=A0A5B8MCA8_9CHLO|nr:dihydrolipoamide acetyltransferase [Chloropicon primus]UPQ96890.1 dihydrolipoamide acetyltransferase [Chloropicon primus]|eukprot:QDZ17674.1 dihydrolipoamide acetyltransferase [Chloropicon primus]
MVARTAAAAVFRLRTAFGATSVTPCELKWNALARGFSSWPAHYTLTMPSLSPTMEKGNLSKWIKAEGDSVAAGDVVAEIETDKATMEMDSQEEGFLAKVLVPGGSSDIAVGTPIAILAEEEEDVPKFANYATEAGAASDEAEADSRVETQAAPATTSGRNEEKVHRIGPAVQRIVRELNIDLSAVVGTGPRGIVTKGDLLHAEGSPAPPAPAAERPAATTATAQDSGASGSLVPEEYEDVAVSQMRSVIAQRLLMSKQTIPHYYLTMDCEVDALMSLRSKINASPTAEKAGKVSLNDFVVKACALACQEVPECNAEWMGDAIRLHKNVHVGVAMDLGSLGHSQGGLVVPVVKNVQLKGVSAISRAVKDYAARARPADGVDGKMRLSPEEMDGGTFTVSNLGMMGMDHFAAIANPPQSCILAVGGLRSEVVKDGPDNLKEAKFMSVTLSCDHRVVDGAVGAKWLQKFKELMENPLQMLLN